MTARPIATAARVGDVPAVYYALMAEIERNRKRLGIPMWQLSDGAGAPSRYFAKALYPETPSGRIATWASVQIFMEALFPEGFSLTIKPAKSSSLPVSEKHRITIRFSGARYDFEERRDWMAELSKKGASKGGRARAEKLSPRRRRAIARKGGKARWSTPKIEEITREDAK